MSYALQYLEASTSILDTVNLKRGHWPSPVLFSSEIPIVLQLLVSGHPSPTPVVAFLPDVVIQQYTDKSPLSTDSAASAKIEHIHPLTTFSIGDIHCCTNLERCLLEATWNDMQKTISRRT